MRTGVVAHEPGTLVVVRTVTAGRIRWASTAFCVRDDVGAIAFYQSNLAPNKVTAGAAARWPDRRSRELALREELVRGDFVLVDKIPAKGEPTLTVAHPDESFSVRFINRDGWRPEYVNVCLPYRRSTIGFDTDDLCLDFVAKPQPCGAIVWEPKDDQDLDERAAFGIYTGSQVEAIREVGAQAIRRVADGAAPFDGSWNEWSPDPAWAAPYALPPAWADDLVALRLP